ncbi:MAG: DUF721 domain-containing protein [Bifidobacteriaceae bacterium]|nr:DUF721 domain-containing protein [Bifidobacteriaceae bacterium]
MSAEGAGGGQPAAAGGEAGRPRAERGANPAELAALNRVKAGALPSRRRRPRGDGPARGRDPLALGEALDWLIEADGLAPAMAAAGVVARWDAIVGEAIAGHCQPESFDSGALVVRADSAPWATQLRLLLPQLEAKLAKAVGEGTVTSVVVRGPAQPRPPRGAWSVRR